MYLHQGMGGSTVRHQKYYLSIGNHHLFFSKFDISRYISKLEIRSSSIDFLYVQFGFLKPGNCNVQTLLSIHREVQLAV